MRRKRRDWSEAAKGAGIASLHRKSGEEHGADSPSDPLEGTNPSDILISDVKEYTSVILSHPVSDHFFLAALGS